MTAEVMISPVLPAAQPSDDSARVLAWMAEYDTHQLSVVRDAELLGLISSDEIRRAGNADAPIADMQLMHPAGTFVYPQQHAYDVVSLMSASGNSVVPVLDTDNRYRGSIGRLEVLRFVAEMATTTEAGGIIVLQLEQNNYQLRQIASIIEENGARVLSVYLSHVPDSTDIYVTVKVNQSELTQIMLGFERFGYKVVHAFFDQKQLDDTQDRYEALMHFLNI